MAKYNVAQAKAQFSSLLRRAAKGEDVVIAKDNQPIARLVPFGTVGEKRIPNAGKTQVLFVAADFDAPLTEFDEYQ